MTFKGEASTLQRRTVFLFIRAHPGFCMTHTSRSRLFATTFIIVSLLLPLPVEGQEDKWAWKDGSGTSRTRAELEKILRDHDERQRSVRGRWADLDNADLTGANLAGANLSLAYLRSADLTGADLSNRIPDKVLR